jgi:hypothetical protein
MMTSPRGSQDELTVWRIVGLPGVHVNMDVELTIGTTSPIVIAAVEQACQAYGIELEPGNQERLW